MKIHDMQQRSIEWYKIRHAKITGTTVKDVFSARTQRTLVRNIVSEMMTEPEIDGYVSQEMQWGIDCEDEAIAALSNKVGIEFRNVGFLSHETLPFGISPDGVEINDGVVIGGAEIKCPNSNTHVGNIMGDCIPKDHIYQVLAPFLLSESVQYWYFASYDPRNYDIPLFYKKITREQLAHYELEPGKPYKTKADKPPVLIGDLSAKLAEIEDFAKMVKKAHENLIWINK